PLAASPAEHLPRPRAPGPAGGRVAACAPRVARGADPAGAGGRPAEPEPGGGGRGPRRGARHRVREARATRRGGVSDARPPRPQAGALRPSEPRPLGPREPRVLALHLA